MTRDMEELKRLAEAATKGPWAKFSEDRTWHDSTTVVDDSEGEACVYARSVTDARFIAAANPAAILALLEKVAVLEADNAALLHRLTVLTRRTLFAVEGMRDPDLESARKTALVAEQELKKEHPGAALLERVRRLEEALREYMEHGASDMADAQACEALK